MRAISWMLIVCVALRVVDGPISFNDIDYDIFNEMKWRCTFRTFQRMFYNSHMEVVIHQSQLYGCEWDFAPLMYVNCKLWVLMSIEDYTHILCTVYVMIPRFGGRCSMLLKFVQFPQWMPLLFRKKKNNQKCSLLNLNSYIVGYTFLICSAQTENIINQLMNLFETNVQT